MNKQDMTYKTPYAESDEYVDALVKRATEKAITRSKEKKGKKVMYIPKSTIFRCTFTVPLYTSII